MTLLDPEILPPDTRILSSDRIPELSVLRFVPGMAARQRNQPDIRCTDRVISDYELIYYVGGSGFVIIGEERIQCQRGVVVLIRPWEPHSIISSVTDPHDNHWIHFRIEPEVLASSVVDAAFPPGSRGLTVGFDATLHSLLEILELEITKKETGYAEVTSGLLTAVFLRIWRRVSSHIELKAPDREALLLARVEESIKRSLPGKIEIGRVCQEFAISRSVLYGVFSRHRGIPPASWIRRERLRSAEQLIKSGNLSLAQIADRTGFSDAFHLSKCFKEVYGSSPRDWMAGLRG